MENEPAVGRVPFASVAAKITSGIPMGLIRTGLLLFTIPCVDVRAAPDGTLIWSGR